MDLDYRTEWSVGTTIPREDLRAEPSSGSHRNRSVLERGKPSRKTATKVSYGITSAAVPRTNSGNDGSKAKPETSQIIQQIPVNPVPIYDYTSIFQYSNLEDREFRLVLLRPGNTLTIECDIVHRRLGRGPEYIALSYAWGDEDDRIDIRVHGHRHSITASLHAALGALRRQDETVVLWADALSINQDHKEEQALQVQLMTDIYSQASSVAVWLGDEGQDGELAVRLLDSVQDSDSTAMEILINDKSKQPEFDALVSLFEREYWRRLWVVQEVLNAKSVVVYCGKYSRPWSTYVTATKVFYQNAKSLGERFRAGTIKGLHYKSSKHQLPYFAVLTSQGPASLESLKRWQYVGPQSLLEILHSCRWKLTKDPRDKVFGVLGILPWEVRITHSLKPNYRSTLREVYTNVVEFMLDNTWSFDVVCEAVYFPLYTSSNDLPSWVPDWSHVPQTGALCLSYDFAASRDYTMEGGLTNVVSRFVEPQRKKLEISAVDLGKIFLRSVAVGTLCGLDDSLMAFLHWRAKLLQEFDFINEEIEARRLHEAFCRTLCLGQETGWCASEWVAVCYYIFGSLIRERLPLLQVDADLQRHADLAEEQVHKLHVKKEERRRILEDNCSRRMMSRCFFITNEGLMGMGTGFMDPDDIMCVPFGSSTPVLLRPEGDSGEYRFVGDVYVDGYMDGKAMEDWHINMRVMRKYVLH